MKLPLIQGMTFATGSLLIADDLIIFLVVPSFARLLHFFPPVVTGTLLTAMGTTLLSVSVRDIVAWTDKGADDAAKITSTFEGRGFPSGQSRSSLSSSFSSRES